MYAIKCVKNNRPVLVAFADDKGKKHILSNQGRQSIIADVGEFEETEISSADWLKMYDSDKMVVVGCFGGCYND